MQIVIDIPEERYNDIRTKNEHSQIFNAVKNGIPLPKGHGRLIDADKIMRVDLEDVEKEIRKRFGFSERSTRTIIDHIFGFDKESED